MCSQVLWINQRKPDIRLNIAWHEVFGNSPIAGAKMKRELAGIDRQPADGRGIWDNLTLLFVKKRQPNAAADGRFTWPRCRQKNLRIFCGRYP
jgi:hypothetical protein